MTELIKLFKCYICKNIPESDVYICENSHLCCPSCSNKRAFICCCSSKLTIKVDNPLESALENVNSCCTYKNKGCTWKFAWKDLKKHAEECKYRPYKCIGKILNAWDCPWEGIHCETLEHFRKSHKRCSSVHMHSGDDTLSFVQNTIALKEIHLIDAFNKIFVFYYEMDPIMKFINIIIFLMGRKTNANNYLYELEFSNENDENEKIKFLQTCHSDSENIMDLIRDGKCISLPFRVIKNYVKGNSIKYRFRMVKKK